MHDIISISFAQIYDRNELSLSEPTDIAIHLFVSDT